MSRHDHPLEGDCAPTCPAWGDGVLELNALLRRHDAMLAACRAAERIEFLVVAPATPGVELPDFLLAEEVVRLNLVVGRDCPEVLLDEWGVRASLTFRRRRHECALPWAAVLAGGLAPPAKRRPRFGVVEGGETAAPASAPAAPEGPGASAAPAAAPSAPRERPVFGVIPGGRSDGER